MATPSICTQCGNINKQKLGVKGSGLIELLLWLFVFPIGIIYSIWRRSGRKNICTVCKSDQVIPMDSPRAKKILEDSGSSQEAYEEEAKKQEAIKQEKLKKESKQVWIVLAILIGMIIVIPAISVLTNPAPEPSVNTYTPPTKVSTFELGTYKVESEEFQYTSTKTVNLWQSYSDRTLTGKVSEGDIVEVSKHDDTNDYCYITKTDQEGWTACGWLVKI